MTGHYLITGGCGFIGRALSRALLARGARVRVLDAMVPQVHGERRTDQGAARPQDMKDVEVIVGDMRDAETVRRAVRRMDGVFHLAAEVGVGQSMYEIARYTGANDLGTAVLLEALIAEPVPRLVLASSMSVYGEGLYRTADGAEVQDARRSAADLAAGRWDPVDAQGRALTPIPTHEDKPVDLASIYALTKYAQERAVLIFGATYPTETVALRLFNVFGPGQALSNPYTGVLANFGSRLINGNPATVFEDGRQMRDFVHVEDVARAFCLAMDRAPAAGHVINIGSGRSYSIASVAEMLGSALGRPHLPPEILNKARSGDIRHCFADISRARDLLGFRPERQLEGSMDELVAWIAAETSVDKGAQMRRELEERGLVR